MSKFTLALKAGIDGVSKRSGKTPDTIACGSDDLATRVRESLAELGLDMHVIADDELSKDRYWIFCQENLGQFPGGGRN